MRSGSLGTAHRYRCLAAKATRFTGDTRCFRHDLAIVLFLDASSLPCWVSRWGRPGVGVRRAGRAGLAVCYSTSTTTLWILPVNFVSAGP